MVRLWDYEDEIQSGDLPELAPLLPLLFKRKDEGVLSKTRVIILQSADPKWRPNAPSIAVTVPAGCFEKEFLYEFFKEEVVMPQEVSIFEDWIIQGMEKGIERALEKGRRISQIETIREDIFDVLAERFRIVTKAISKGLNAVDDPALLR